MGRLILFNFITVDGFFEGKNHELDWHNVDAEFHDFAVQQLDTADTLVFGRKTYELMKNYWTSNEAIATDKIIADKMNSYIKIVFSKSLDKAEWMNTVFFKNNIEEVIQGLKQKSYKDILILGSANLTSTLQRRNLIDEYRIMVNPIILGDGVPLFKPIHERQQLKLIQTRVFESGNILLYFQPKLK